MAEVKGAMTVKDRLSVDKNAKFHKGLDSPYLEIIDSKASGTAGGTFPGNRWQTRDLNTTIHNDFATSISSNQFVIPAGKYHIEASAPAFEVESHVGRLADVTDAAGEFGETVVLGTAEYSPDTDLWRDGANLAMTTAAAAQTRTRIEGRFEVTRSTTLEIQHRGFTAKTTNGFGVDAGFYVTNNVFTIVKMWQVKDNS